MSLSSNIFRSSKGRHKNGSPGDVPFQPDTIILDVYYVYTPYVTM